MQHQEYGIEFLECKLSWMSRVYFEAIYFNNL